MWVISAADGQCVERRSIPFCPIPEQYAHNGLMNFYQHTYLPGAGSFSNDSRKMLQCRHQQQAVPLCLPPGTGLQGALRLLHEAADNSLIMRPKMCWSGIRKNLILRKYVLFFCLQGRRSKPQAMMKDLVCPAVHRSWYRPPWHTPPGTGPLAQAVIRCDDPQPLGDPRSWARGMQGTWPGG